MGVNKRNIVIITCLVVLSFLLNSFSYIRNQITGPLFYYHYIETDGSYFNINYLRNIYDNDRVIQITLPEYDNFSLKIGNINSGLNSFIGSNLNYNEKKIKNKYFLTNLNCTLFNTEEEKKFFEKYKTDNIKITKIQYTTNSGKSEIVNIGEINVDFKLNQKIEKNRNQEDIYVLQTFSTEKEAGITIEANTYGEIRFSKDYVLNKEIFKFATIILNGEKINSIDESFKVEKGDSIKINLKFKEELDYYYITAPIMLDFTKVVGGKMVVPVYFRSSYINENNINAIKNLKVAREME